MNTSAANERPPTPPHSTDGESDNMEGKSQPQPIDSCTSLQSTLHTPKLGDTLVSEHETPEAQPSSQSPQRQDPYGDPSMYQTAAPANNFYPIQPTLVRTTQLQTPPATYDNGRIHTRSGRTLGSPLSPTFRNSSRVAKLPRVKSTLKASKKSKGAKTGAPLIDQPLSILTKDYKIPVKDMDAWVHRPVSERLQQAKKNKGHHISRPMNSFMLYRSAYADRAKHFCKENNHQVVSQVTGTSWPLEPKKVREMYEEFARIERDAHANAHPDYKFAPNKSGVKRPRFDEDEDDDDLEWQGPRIKRSQTRTSGVSRSHSSTPFDDRFQPQYQPTIHPSSYWASNPHSQPPMGMDPESYYQPVAKQYNAQLDGITMRGMHFPPYEQRSLFGLPNNNHPVLLGMQYPEQIQGDVLDPQLAGGEQQYQYSHYDTVNPGYEAPRSYEYSAYPVIQQQYYQEQPPSFHPGMATLTDGQNSWEEAVQAGTAFDEAFQRWP